MGFTMCCFKPAEAVGEAEVLTCGVSVGVGGVGGDRDGLGRLPEGGGRMRIPRYLNGHHGHPRAAMGS